LNRTDLSSISLSRPILFLSTPVTLSSLRVLSLRHVSFSPLTATQLFRSETLPSLRILVFTAAGWRDHLPSRKIADEIPSTFLEQLDLLQLQAEDHLLFSPPLFTLSTPSLITAKTIKDLLSISEPYYHLRYLQWYDDSDSTAEELVDLRDRVKQSSLVSLHLPRIASSDVAESQPLSDALRKLLGSCRRRAIEVLWFDGDEEEQHALSPSFEHYVLRRKATRTQEVVEGQ
jgi:hypothetical protein